MGTAVIALVPAYNEEQTVGGVVKAALESGAAATVLVVNDGSEDGTSRAARAAGAEVLDLPENHGKARAIAAGAEFLLSNRRLGEDYPVLLLDADLVGLQGTHVRDLVKPVLSGEADMTVGIFTGGRSATDLAQKIAPFLSGQRALRLGTLVRALAETRAAGFGVEMSLTTYAKRGGLKVKHVPLAGVTHVMKEEKMGFFAGATARMKMYGDIAAAGARLLVTDIGTRLRRA